MFSFPLSVQLIDYWGRISLDFEPPRSSESFRSFKSLMPADPDGTRCVHNLLRLRPAADPVWLCVQRRRWACARGLPH